MSQPKKKMNLVQLTFIVAVNMMGSGIIMLPTNMAKVGAISLLSWIVTALGSMALAYGFAQAGIFNQRSGGLASYAEDAYGKDGYFQAFFLYFLSLAIGNVAIAISAVGYLATFFPGMSATPIATCMSVIALLWLTTVANFGGPSLTGKIGSITVWGVIIPVGALSFIGWFWFSSDTFAAAWNPQGMSLGEGMGSSIALTLWAFLGMESAAQNSDAVENPKRDVPLACLFGTLGAAVIYVLSTTVIQGIVPNAELADSTGPFGLAFAKMFNPTVGSIIMVLAILACLGSLLGWQFTLSSTAKSAADGNMFPKAFSKVNSLGAPITGMIILGVVQTALALSTISPTLSEQFGALVNLAVVTNVIPYILALSALPVMMKANNVASNVYTRNMVIGDDRHALQRVRPVCLGRRRGDGRHAGHGRHLHHLGLHLESLQGLGVHAERPLNPNAPRSKHMSNKHHPRFAASQSQRSPSWSWGQWLPPRPSPETRSTASATAATCASPIFRRPSRSRRRAPSGTVEGYGAALCERIAAGLKSQLGLAQLAVDWVPVTIDTAANAVAGGQADVLCTPSNATLARRKTLSFSIPVFAGGIRAVVREDVTPQVREALENNPQDAAGVAWHTRAGHGRSHPLRHGRGHQLRTLARGEESELQAQHRDRVRAGLRQRHQVPAGRQDRRVLRRARRGTGRDGRQRHARNSGY